MQSRNSQITFVVCQLITARNCIYVVRVNNHLHEAVSQMTFLCLHHKTRNFGFRDHMYAGVCAWFCHGQEVEQSSNLKFCIKFEEPGTKTLSRLHQAYSDEVVVHIAMFQVALALQKKNVLGRRWVIGKTCDEYDPQSYG